MPGTVLGAGDMAVNKTIFQSRAHRLLWTLWAVDELVNYKLHLSVFGLFLVEPPCWYLWVFPLVLIR